MSLFFIIFFNLFYDNVACDSNQNEELNYIIIYIHVTMKLKAGTICITEYIVNLFLHKTTKMPFCFNRSLLVAIL